MNLSYEEKGLLIAQLNLDRPAADPITNIISVKEFAPYELEVIFNREAFDGSTYEDFEILSEDEMDQILG